MGVCLAPRSTLLADTVAIAVPRVSTTGAMLGSRALPASVLLLAAVAPFERPMAGSILGLTLTTSELAILVALGLAAVTWWHDRASFRWRTPITLPLMALVACAFVAAAAAPEFRGNALRVAGRFAAGATLFVVIANVAVSQHLAKQIAAVLLFGAAIVGAIAVLELTQLPWVMETLKNFRPGFHVVGGQLRATSTLAYPTIASMFLEIAFALGLVWLASSWLAFAGLALAAAGIIATFTRAGLITMAMSLVVYGGLLFFRQPRPPTPRLRRPSWDGEHTRLALLAVAVAGLMMMSRSPQMLMARVSTEGSQDWYGASYQVPQRLTLRPDSFNDVPVTLTNGGRLTWQSNTAPPFALSYHWLSIDTEEVVIYDGLRTPFAQPVAPGEAVTLQARLRAPQYPGTYLLIWDIVQEHRTWLSLEGVFPGRTIASVEGPAVGAPLPTRGRMPGNVMRMPRSVLWRTALQISRDHPVLGIGPDSFRHVYGRYLGLSAWDDRVHANNAYLEVLVGMGALGALALVWLLVAAAVEMKRLLLVTPERLPLVAAATAACLAIAAHALVDSFATFTPTYVAFAIGAGLLFSSSLAASHSPVEREQC